MMRAKLIQDGDHQTIVLPPSIHLEGDEVIVERAVHSGDLTISQVQPRKRPDWAAVFRALDEAGVPDDFLVDRDQGPPQERSEL